MRAAQVAILGAGPAGCAAAVQCRRLGLEPVLLDRSGTPGGLIANAFCVENYPGLEEPLCGLRLAERFAGHLARFDLQVEQAEVEAITHSRGELVLQGSVAIAARAVILAPGTLPLRLDVPGARELEGEALFYELRALLGSVAAPREVVIVGGGEAACDYALSLAAIGCRVALVGRSGGLRARGRLAQAVRAKAAVELLLGWRCEQVSAGRRAAVGLRDAQGEPARREADAVLVAIGRRSAAAELLGAAVAPNGSVTTPVPGLFIAGDARVGGLGQVGIAVGDGLAAAAAALTHLEG